MTYKEDFQTKGYCIFPRALLKEEASKLWSNIKSKIDQGTFDGQSPGNPSFYKDVEICKIHIKLLSLVEEVTGLKLYPTYTYNRIYKLGAILPPHLDRPACEISVSLCVGYDGNYNWPLWLKDRKGENKEYILEPGDMIVYMGCEIEHWREPYTKGVLHGAIFLHYVDQDGPYENCIYDMVKI